MSWGLGPGRDVPPAPKSCAPAKPITPAAIPATGPKTVPTAVSTSVAICSAPLFHAPDSKHGPGRWKRRLHHAAQPQMGVDRSEEHTSELQSLMRTSYAVFCLKKKKKTLNNT